jgi:hypothetical protein
MLDIYGEMLVETTDRVREVRDRLRELNEKLRATVPGETDLVATRVSEIQELSVLLEALLERARVLTEIRRGQLVRGTSAGVPEWP